MRVLSVPEDKVLSVRFLGPYDGLLVHWQGGRNHPCDGPERCLPAHHKVAPVWKGYAPVEEWEPRSKRWCPAVLEITSNLEEYLRGHELRGEVWALNRQPGEGKTAAVIGVCCHVVGEDRLSKCFDMMPVLLRLYNRSSLRMGQANPMPPQLVLPSVAGDAPELPDQLRALDEPRQATPEQLQRFREQLKGTLNGHHR